MGPDPPAASVDVYLRNRKVLDKVVLARAEARLCHESIVGSIALAQANRVNWWTTLRVFATA